MKTDEKQQKKNSFKPDTLTLFEVGTGFKDEDLKVLTEALKKVVAPKKPMEFEVNTSAFDCDVWFQPSMVWEVKCADLQVSPVHTAGIGKVNFFSYWFDVFFFLLGTSEQGNRVKVPTIFEDKR